MIPDIKIEYPTLLTTSVINEYGVFEYTLNDRYFASWTGQSQHRVLLASYNTLDEAQKAYPDALVVRHFSIADSTV
jgi:hypothetical protein